MSKLNAATVTRSIKKELRLAALPAYRVTTRYTRLGEKTEQGELFGWQAIVHDLDEESIEVVELVMGNVPNLIKVSRSKSSSFLSVIVRDR